MQIYINSNTYGTVILLNLCNAGSAIFCNVAIWKALQPATNLTVVNDPFTLIGNQFDLKFT